MLECISLKIVSVPPKRQTKSVRDLKIDGLLLRMKCDSSHNRTVNEFELFTQSEVARKMFIIPCPVRWKVLIKIGEKDDLAPTESKV